MRQKSVSRKEGRNKETRKKKKKEERKKRRKGKRRKEGINKEIKFFLQGVSWLEGYCTFLMFSDECYLRSCTSAFSAEASNKFALPRTAPSLQYWHYIQSSSCAPWFPQFHPPAWVQAGLLNRKSLI